MRRLAWATDIHLDFAYVDNYNYFVDSIKSSHVDALLLTGDISNGVCINGHLRELQRQLDLPIYFNLGNHDFYGKSIAEIRQWAKGVTKQKVPLYWLGAMTTVPLADRISLVGIDGWGDGQLGNAATSSVLLNDWDKILEFSIAHAIDDRAARMRILQKLSQADAHRLDSILTQAMSDCDQMLIMTHVPPWREATWHRGEHSDDDWLPWFSCKAVGDVISAQFAKHETKHATVLCGHTHGSGASRISPQIETLTGHAIYRSPELQMVLSIQDGKLIQELNKKDQP